MFSGRLLGGLGLVAIASSFLVACVDTGFTTGTDGDASGLDEGNPYIDMGGNTGPKRPVCPGQEATITGTILAPNGLDPVPGATVFVPSKTPEMFVPEVRCEACGSLGTSNNFWTTTSKEDGTFVLTNVCPGPRNLVIQNGRFRRFLQLNVPAKGILTLDREQSRLPRRNGEFHPIDAIPKIAVVTGDYDKMECVLHKMGVEKFDLFEGAKTLVSPNHLRTFKELVNFLPAMKSYNIIFINCTANTFEDELKKKTVRDNIIAYVRAGGRLYITDWSYDWIEQIEGLAKFIDFEPGPSGDSPEPPNAATIGKGGLKVQASLKDKNLIAWLENFPGVVQTSGTQKTAKIEHFLPQWVMINRLGKDVKLWVEGPVSSGLGGQIHNEVRPLTLTFNFKACGKILFSSYHTEGRDEESPLFPEAFPHYCGKTSSSSPQDRILEYLIFDIANCIKPIG